MNADQFAADYAAELKPLLDHTEPGGDVPDKQITDDFREWKDELQEAINTGE